MEEEWQCNTDPELSQLGQGTSQDFCLWEEVTVQEFYQQQEAFPCGVVRRQEQHQCEVGVRVQWGDGAQQEMEVFHWEESVTVQELSQWDKEDETNQELSLWEGKGDQELSPLEEDVGVPLRCCQREGDQRQPEGDNKEKELTQAKGYNVQQLPKWGKDGSNKNLSQREQCVSSQRLCQWREGLTHKICDKPLHPEKDKCTRPCAQQGPASPSSVGTPVAAEATHELPSASPVLGGPTKDELEAAAVPAGATEEVEEPPEPLAPEMEKAPGSPAHSEELPLAGTESPVAAPRSPSGSSPALPDSEEEHISSEVVLEAGLEVQASDQQPEEQGDLEQSMAAETEAAAPEQREESPSSAPHSPPSPSPSPLGAQALREQQEEADRGSVLAEEKSEEGALAGELENSQHKDEEHTELSQGEINEYQEGSQGEICTEEELSQAEASSCQEGSQGSQASTEQKLSLEETSGDQEWSSGETSTEQDLSSGETSCCQEGSQWEASIELELSLEETSSDQEESEGETGTELELSLEETSSDQEGSEGETCTEQELSSAECGCCQEGFQGEACNEQELSSAESGCCQEGFQREACNEQELPLEEACSHHELCDWDECVEEELSHGDAGNYQEVSDWEECTEQCPSQGHAGSSHNLSDWEEYREHELPHGDVGSCQEVSDWEESNRQELSQEEDSIGQEVFRGNSERPSVESSWASDSDQDLMQDSWEESTGAKPLLQEDDEWDERSVLKLSEDENREPRLTGLTGGGFFVQVPHEVWVELGASGPCLGGPICASSPPVEAPAPRGHTASPAFQEQVPQARMPQARTRQALRALRSLLCFPCMMPPPED
ncbi:uncharacterized protein LOC135298678 [Passer domesticus]|uniref:uncharacterized protein LOC135298678 n=1 Tax=Passer domesticus TaxID=48849 RepID=UPI0030FEB411